MQQLALFTPMKRCSQCGELKPATTEYFSKSGKWLRGDCKACRREYKRKWYETNREERREVKRKWQESNPEKQREYERKWREANREKKREYDRKWCEANRAKQRLKAQRRRARKRALPDTLTDTQIEHMLDYFDYKCAVCGTPLDLFIKLELDHWIPLTSDDCTGTIATNIVPLCGGSQFVSHTGCNPSKGDKDAMDWLVQQYGTRKAKQIMKRIQAYFEWVKQQDKTL